MYGWREGAGAVFVYKIVNLLSSFLPSSLYTLQDDAKRGTKRKRMKDVLLYKMLFTACSTVGLPWPVKDRFAPA